MSPSIRRTSTLIITILLSSSALSQEINKSNIVTGKNGQITYNINISNPGKSDELYLITTSLGFHLQTTSTQSANSAHANGRFALAADIWGKISEDALNIRRAPYEAAQALAKKAEAEVNFDKTKASESINSAIKLDPKNLALTERAAIIEITRNNLEEAKKHLVSMINEIENGNSKTAADTAYLAYCRMFGIQATQGNETESIEYVKKAANVFNEKLPQALQRKFKELQYSLYGTAIESTAKQILPDPVLGTLFSRTQNLLDEGNTFSHISTSHNRFWYSLKTGVLEEMKNEDFSEKSPISPPGKNSEYILTDYQYKINQAMLRLMEDTKNMSDPSSTSSRRLMQFLYNDLLILSESCEGCPQYAKNSHLPSMVLGNYYNLISDPTNAYTLYSLALSEIQKAIKTGPGTQSEKLTEIKILLALGDIRNAELISIGDPVADNIRIAPYSIALSKLTNLRKLNPNNAYLVALSLEISSKLRHAYIQASNLSRAKSVCESSLNDFVSLKTNPIYTRESFDNFLNCQFSILLIDKIRGQTSDLMSRREAVIRIARESNMIRDGEDISWLPKIDN